MTARPLVPTTRVKMFFSKDCKITKHDVQGVPPVLNTKSRLISTVLQYHSWLETVSLFVTARAHIVPHIALFFLSRCR